MAQMSLPPHEVADLGRAPDGAARVAWAEQQMPVLRRIRERFAEQRPLAGVRIAACLHVTAETANLILALAAGGAEPALCSANPLSTQDDVAATLVVDHRIQVRACMGKTSTPMRCTFAPCSPTRRRSRWTTGQTSS